jgi:hypothetical protein
MTLRNDKDNEVREIKTNNSNPRESRPDPGSCKKLVPEAGVTPTISAGPAGNTATEVRPSAMKYYTRDGDPFEGDEESFRQTFGTTDSDLSGRLLLQVNLASPNDLREDHEGINASLAALHAIAPRDGLEGMLATQMVAMHNHAISWLGKTKQSGLPEEVIDAYVNRANKCMRTFAMQYSALHKGRRSGSESMVVEQVHVHEGAQAVVGQVGQQGSIKDSEEENERPN